MPVVGLTGKQALKPFLKLMQRKIGDIVVSHEFLYMLECPIPLLRRDLLCKFRAQITFSDKSIQLHLPKETAWKAQFCS